jgi:glycolate oxidase iron-sulfur subunit
LTPKPSELFRRLPRVTEPAGEVRGTVALVSGCVQDRWFRGVNRATIRVLARNGWRVVVPRAQVCCGALAAHHGRLDTARTLAAKPARFDADVIDEPAGCGAHLQELATRPDRRDPRVLLEGSRRDDSAGGLRRRRRAS